MSPYPVGFDPRHTSPLIPCTSYSIACRVRDTSLWTVCRTLIRRILRDPVRRTVYRARCQGDTKIIRPFVPLSRIVYRYNVMQASRADRTCCGSTKTRTEHRSTLVSPTKADAAGTPAKGENHVDPNCSRQRTYETPCAGSKAKKVTVSAKESLVLHTKFRENLIRNGTL